MDTQIEELKEIFNQFYYKLLSDPYYANFFNTYSQVDTLIEKKQIFFILDVVSLLSDGNETEAYKKMLSVASLHKRLNISSYFMFKGIEILQDLMEDAIELKHLSLDSKMVKKYFHLMKKSTAEVYIKSLIDDALVLLKVNNKWQKHQKENLEKIKEFVERENIDNSFRSFIKCPLEEYIESIEFKVKTALNKKDRYKFQLYHNQFHRLLKEFAELFEKQQYLESTLIVEDIVNIALILNTLIEDIELRWELKKEESYSNYLMETARKFSIKVIPPQFGKNLDKKIVYEVYKFLQSLYEGDKNIFIFIHNNTINIICEDIEFDFELLTKKLKTFCKEKCIIEESIMKIASLDVSLYHKQKLNEKLIVEITKIIEKKIKQMKSKEIILIHDFTPEIEQIIQEAKENLEIKDIIKEAVKKKDVSIFVQEIVNLQNLEIIAGEILARIFKEDKPIPAYRFIEIIREENLETEFDIAVLKSVEKNMHLLSYNKIFINIFPNSLEVVDMVEQLNRLLEKAKSLNKLIILEITEYNLIDYSTITEILRKKNVEIAFDDFGIGYTNFELVGTLASHSKANTLKIDGSLVKNIDNPVYKSILKAIATFASESKLNVIFEFIENEEVLEKVKKLVEGLKLNVCGQGWYFSKPHPVNSN